MRPIRRILVAVRTHRPFESGGRHEPCSSPVASTPASSCSVPSRDSRLHELRPGRARTRGSEECASDGKVSSALESIAGRGRALGIEVKGSNGVGLSPREAIVRRTTADGRGPDRRRMPRGKRVAPLFALHLTDWELLRYGPMPVLLVKSRKPYDRPTLLAAVDPTHANAKPARLDDEILDVATALRRTLRGSLRVAHAFVPIPGDVQTVRAAP